MRAVRELSNFLREKAGTSKNLELKHKKIAHWLPFGPLYNEPLTQLTVGEALPSARQLCMWQSCRSSRKWDFTAWTLLVSAKEEALWHCLWLQGPERSEPASSQPACGVSFHIRSGDVSKHLPLIAGSVYTQKHSTRSSYMTATPLTAFSWGFSFFRHVVSCWIIQPYPDVIPPRFVYSFRRSMFDLYCYCCYERSQVIESAKQLVKFGFPLFINWPFSVEENWHREEFSLNSKVEHFLPWQIKNPRLCGASWSHLHHGYLVNPHTLSTSPRCRINQAFFSTSTKAARLFPGQSCDGYRQAPLPLTFKLSCESAARTKRERKKITTYSNSHRGVMDQNSPDSVWCHTTVRLQVGSGMKWKIEPRHEQNVVVLTVSG